MTVVNLVCSKSPSVRIGPASEVPFIYGFAEIDPARLPGWRAIVTGPGCPTVHELPPGSALLDPSVTGAALCRACGSQLPSFVRGRDEARRAHWASHAGAIVRPEAA